MSGNTFGTIFKLTTFGESHGVALGAIVDGCPPNIPLTVEDIQEELDRRKPNHETRPLSSSCLNFLILLLFFSRALAAHH